MGWLRPKVRERGCAVCGLFLKNSFRRKMSCSSCGDERSRDIIFRRTLSAPHVALIHIVVPISVRYFG
jgi:hypothetical protein